MGNAAHRSSLDEGVLLHRLLWWYQAVAEEHQNAANAIAAILHRDPRPEARRVAANETEPLSAEEIERAQKLAPRYFVEPPREDGLVFPTMPPHWICNHEAWELSQSTESMTIEAFAHAIGVKLGTVKRWGWEGMPVKRRRVVPRDAIRWIVKHRKDSIAFGRKSVVYFVRDHAGRIKIGLSSDVQRRLVEIRKMVNGPVELLGTIEGDKEVELALHERFASDRLEGEWFCASEAVMAAIPKQKEADDA
ncbi:GIY-YIG nuclease family protein [Sorangium sp. So ce134]